MTNATGSREVLDLVVKTGGELTPGVNEYPNVPPTRSCPNVISADPKARTETRR